MKFFKRLRKILLVGIGICILISGGIFTYLKLTPTIDITKDNSITLLDKDENVFFQGNGTSKWVSIDKISNYLIDATIAGEDKNFYKHFGFDPLRIGKAMVTNITTGSKQGASTITQQYAKNLYLNFDQTWKRKWQELWITLEIESHYSKKEILEGYLNTINYGHGMYGIENASQFYFEKSSKDLTLAEASLLAGVPKAPSTYSPINNYSLSKKRQHYTLSTMVKNKFITKEEMDKAYRDEIKIVKNDERKDLTSIMYYKNNIMDELKDIKEIPKSLIETGGLKVYTTLDSNAQKILEDNTNKYIDKSSKIQASGIMINPKSGALIALIGGRDYNTSEYNRAIYAKRQVGSTMKPFLYYAALENGFTSSSSFTSEVTTFTFSNNENYAPKNYNEKYANKPISMATAIAYSDNIYAVKTHMFLGENTLVDFTKRLGFTSKLTAVPSLPLGTNEINLLELASGYSAFANNGYKIKPYSITKVVDNSGKVLYEHKDESIMILNSSLTFILSNLLTSTYNSKFIDYNYPTAIGISSKMTHSYALKSGSTDTDSVNIGYTPDILTSIWCGYDNNKFMTTSEYRYSQNIWLNTMEDYLKETKNNWYEVPSNVVGVIVDPISGKPANDNTKNPTVLYYLKGSEPSENDTVFDEKNNN